MRELVADFNHWSKWSPWTIADPDCLIDIAGNSKQPGHSMNWSSEVVGAGKNTLELSENHQLNYHLEFFKPWKSKAKVSFLFEEIDDQTNQQIDKQTKVTWKMYSSMPLFLFFMVKTMKNWIGMDYERGLKMLKEVAERGSANCQTINNGIVEYKGFSYVGIKRSVAIENMPTSMQQDFEKLINDIVVNAKKTAERWICIYPKFDIKNMQATYIAAVSDEHLANLKLDAEYVKGKIEDAKMLEIKHNGSYEFLGNAWAMGMMNMQAKKFKAKKFPFEQYWNSPMEVAADDLKTSVYFPLKN